MLRTDSLSWRREKFFTVGEPIRLEEEAEQHRPVGSDCLMLVTGGAPDELARSTFALVILKRALDHVSLFECSMLVQRHDSAWFKLKQSRGDAGVVGIEHLDFDARKLSRPPGHTGHVQIMCRALGRILGLDVGVHILRVCMDMANSLDLFKDADVQEYRARCGNNRVNRMGIEAQAVSRFRPIGSELTTFGRNISDALGVC